MSNIKTFNPLKPSSKRRAFSLIELSIVLIIIGLLIAGITGGASLIKSASLRAAMGEARGYNVAVNSFYVQFDALPGDYGTGISGPVTTSLAGNGDGKIQYANSADIFESNNAWAALRNSGVIDTVFGATLVLTGTGVVPAQAVGASNTIPPSKIKSAGWVFDYINVTTAPPPLQSQNVVVLTGAVLASPARTTGQVTGLVAGTGVALVAPPVGILSPADALSIDVKMDDGIAGSGRVRGLLGNINGTSGCFDSDLSPSFPYTTTLTTNVCALSFQVDIS